MPCGRSIFLLLLPAIVLWVYTVWDDVFNDSIRHEAFIHPIGVALACAYGIAAGIALSVRLARSFRKIKSPGLCPRCDYDLRATPDRCPECGHVPENNSEIST